jgi:hypothetical protein
MINLCVSAVATREEVADTMDTEIIAALLGALASAVIGFLLAILLDYLRRRRKVVEWEYNAISLLVKNGKKRTEDMQLAINKYLITKVEADKNDREYVDNAYVFIVNIQNSGNDIVDDITAEIQLDNLAKIVKCDTQPRSLADYELDPRISENKLDIKIPYLNPKGNRSEVSLEIISIGNGTEDCTVNLFGKGIEERQRRLNVRPRTFGLMYFMLGTLLSSLVVGGVIFVDRTLTTGLLSNPQLPSFGIGGLIVLTLLTMLVWVIQD